MAVGIVAGLPSNRGHHYTLRVWAPLSYTGGLKGLDGGSILLRYLGLRSWIPVGRSGANENKIEPPTTSPARIRRYRCIFCIIVFIYKGQLQENLLLRNLSRNRR